MNFIRSLIFILILLFSFKNSNSQTVKTIEEMSLKHQKCLDSGINMLKCSSDFYVQMDSILNVVYNKLRTKLNSSEKDVLKKEQFEWLKKRDDYYKKEKKIHQQEMGLGEDMYMVIYDEASEYVKDRTLVLLKRIKEKTP